MAEKSRPGGRTARVRAQILAATVDLVAREGVAGFRYEEVAERAGVHRASVYRNWPDRDELVVEALAQYAARQVPFPDTGDLRADLVEFLLGQAAELAEPVGRALENAVSNSESEAVKRTVRRVLDRRLETVRTRLERATDRDELQAVDPLFFAHLVAGPAHLAHMHGVAYGRAEAERTADVVLAGLRATSTTRHSREERG
ncbi:TetR/AcrR family transcriptional regulator [Paractinoplanes lichenicola]|uniref:TetR/AcrR family transcriptional regulator n=1 Tax=Paractinoplanes lichenicola TaxID=2802976 RepID=A0ABS1VMW0_9ACTN|nr:TetR/AcrR family transcriptional regulator [Actinoplanes lichenicola]MBL7255995.1 TetR/AcrR family transcriptional regulator [Actinoplanes lichenicola]